MMHFKRLALLAEFAALGPGPLGASALQAWQQFAGSNTTHRTSVPSYELQDGRKMPVIGFGTYRIMPGPATYNAVTSALREGYRMFDTASMYMNERDVGRAVRDFLEERPDLSREDIYIETKLGELDHGWQRALSAGRASNQRLGLQYIDMYIIHSPGRMFGRIVETWDALQRLRKEGVVRSVGVSNFGEAHLKALADHGRELPQVNQIEIHPMNYNMPIFRTAVDFCKKHHVLVQAYGSVLSGHDRLMDIADTVAERHERTRAQVLLRWALDHGFQVIPKSTHAERQRENFAVLDFNLSAEELEELSHERSGHVGDYWTPEHWSVSIGSLEHGP